MSAERDNLSEVGGSYPVHITGRLRAVSQPAVSKAIADLEHAAGALLLDRSSRGVELTVYGRVLVKHGKAMLDELR